MGWRSSLATLFTSTAKSPTTEAAAAMAACSAGTSRTSQRCHHGAGNPASPIRCASARLASSAMSMKATRAPCRAKAVTIDAPMPLPPPVTNTARPARLG